MISERLRDDRGWAAHWGAEAVRSIAAAVANPHPATIADLDMNHAVRAAKLAWWHSCRAGGYKYWDERWRAQEVASRG